MYNFKKEPKRFPVRLDTDYKRKRSVKCKSKILFPMLLEGKNSGDVLWVLSGFKAC